VGLAAPIYWPEVYADQTAIHVEISLNLYYVIPRASGTKPACLSWGISLYLFRIEPLIPLLFAGFCLNRMSEYWKKLRLEENPVFLKVEMQANWSIRILGVGFGVNLLTGILGTIFMTGFSLAYAGSLTLGIIFALAGNLMAAASAISGRKKLGS
jgi:hypothetical protein